MLKECSIGKFPVFKFVPEYACSLRSSMSPVLFSPYKKAYIWNDKKKEKQEVKLS